MTKKAKRERIWMITADGFNFQVKEDQYNYVLEKINIITGENMALDTVFVAFNEDSDREASICVRADKISRFSTTLVEKEQR